MIRDGQNKRFSQNTGQEEKINSVDVRCDAMCSTF